MALVSINFVHVPDDLEESAGPFEFVQITYNEVRVQRPGADLDDVIAVYQQDGYWHYNDARYTDFTIAAYEER